MKPCQIIGILIIGVPVAILVYTLIASYIKVKKADQQRANEYIEAARRFETIRSEAKSTNRPIMTASQGNPKSFNQPTPITKSRIQESAEVRDNSDFITSMTVAAATDSAIIGMAVGGDPLGAMIGDALNDDDSNRNHSSFDHSSSDSFDSHSSHDSSNDWSSSDSSSSDWSSSDSSSSDWSSSDSSSSSSDW